MITKEYIIGKIQSVQEKLDVLKETNSKSCTDMIRFFEGKLVAYQVILWEFEH